MAIRKINIKPEDNPSDVIYPTTSYDQITLDAPADQDMILGFTKSNNRGKLYLPYTNAHIYQHNIDILLTRETQRDFINFGLTIFYPSGTKFETLSRIISYVHTMSKNSSHITICGYRSANTGINPLLYLMGTSASTMEIGYLAGAQSGIWSLSKTTIDNTMTATITDNVIDINISAELDKV